MDPRVGKCASDSRRNLGGPVTHVWMSGGVEEAAGSDTDCEASVSVELNVKSNCVCACRAEVDSPYRPCEHN